jgi:hypothetical protein
VSAALHRNEVPAQVRTRCYISRFQQGCKIFRTPADLVGVAGFEPTAPRSQSECATKLRYTPSARV